MTTAKQRQTNKVNALKSTGPRSEVGKRIAAQNARGHGLSVPLRANAADPVCQNVAALIEMDGVNRNRAMELASKIVDFERTLKYEREIHARAVGPTMDLSASAIAWQSSKRGKIANALYGFRMQGVPKLDHGADAGISFMQNINRIKDDEHHRRQVLDAKTSLRYLKRTSNQLIKSLKRAAD